jgi:SnoaL-like protein
MGDAPLAAEELGRRFIDAANRRDVDALVALCHPELELLPTMIVSQRAVYHGHDGLRRWVADLLTAEIAYEAHVRRVREFGDDQFAVLAEVRLQGEVITQSALVGRVRDDLIVRAKGYLSDEQTLIRVGVLPPAEP